MFFNRVKLEAVFSIFCLLLLLSSCSKSSLPDHYGVFLDTKEGRKELTQSKGLPIVKTKNWVVFGA